MQAGARSERANRNLGRDCHRRGRENGNLAGGADNYMGRRRPAQTRLAASPGLNRKVASFAASGACAGHCVAVARVEALWSTDHSVRHAEPLLVAGSFVIRLAETSACAMVLFRCSARTSRKETQGAPQSRSSFTKRQGRWAKPCQRPRRLFLSPIFSPRG
jgi:hypothetical protein